jgi:secreted trypsin-like serine protease
MKLIIYFALFVQVSSTKLKNLSPKIIGGRDAEENEFPYIVSIRRAELEIIFGEPYHICGGSIINTDTVITASHCLFDPFGNHLSQPGSYFVIAGFLRIWSDIDTAQRFDVIEIYKHPNFDMEVLQNDIALLKVAPDFTFDLPSIQPISIETNKNLSEGTKCSVHGWGTLLMDFPLYPDLLQTVELKISNFDHCNKTYEGIVDPDTQICAYEPEKDSCSGKTVRTVRVDLMKHYFRRLWKCFCLRRLFSRNCQVNKKNC